MNWSGPNVIHFGRKSQFGPDQFIFVMTISFWWRPNHYGQVQINLVIPKPFWSYQNHFGPTKTVLDKAQVQLIVCAENVKSWFK
jgi:hypothetical protein